ncbi:hypothetical protein SAMN02745116_02476 [Pilibacter termitis]|uniref:Uncharacterized protein n=1 Tax=Pilibacter termitis TaxID=263852 RepID=A0A1T4R7X1_9ENTE|nr:hypothetical protein [Pilibacter termitis]SKA12043.1 hypothetical protein SAMN02745116_02476 [Pilibacter termitis]
MIEIFLIRTLLFVLPVVGIALIVYNGVKYFKSRGNRDDENDNELKF